MLWSLFSFKIKAVTRKPNEPQVNTISSKEIQSLIITRAIWVRPLHPRSQSPSAFCLSKLIARIILFYRYNFAMYGSSKFIVLYAFFLPSISIYSYVYTALFRQISTYHHRSLLSLFLELHRELLVQIWPAKHLLLNPVFMADSNIIKVDPLSLFIINIFQVF